MPNFHLEDVTPVAPVAAPTYDEVPLADLELSDDNVAKIGRTRVADLVASIAAHGLLKNLAVKKREGGGYSVEAGGRRLRALRQLAKEGRWPADRLVPVAILADGASAAEISTTENVTREDMHPVDEFAAFKRLIDLEGLTAADVAARFGKSERYVEQRLRLANISPKILAELEKGSIELSQVIALSVSSDHKEQEKVWGFAKKQGYEYALRPDSLRHALTTQELSVSKSPVAKYLGIADYEAGGGQVRRDIFGGDDDAWMTDPKLARALAKEKLDKELKKIKEEGWLWHQALLEFGYDAKAKFGKYGAKNEYSQVDTTKLDWPAPAKKVAGVVATIGDDGALVLHRGLIRPQDKAKATAAAKEKGGKTVKRSTAADKPARKPGHLSFAQVQVLQAERTAVLRDEISQNPRVAMAALAARLASDLDIVDGGTRVDELIRLSKSTTSEGRLPISVRPVVEKSPAEKALRARIAEWKKRIPKRTSITEYLLSQPETTTHELLALCAARALMAVDLYSGQQDAGAQFAALAQVDMSSHWTPSAAWLEKLPTSYLMDAVTKTHGKQAAASLAKEKGKAAKARRAAQLLNPIAVGEKAPWLPAPLRAPVAKAARESTKQA